MEKQDLSKVLIKDSEFYDSSAAYAAFIQQISDGKILLKDDVYGLSSMSEDKGINWKRILE